MWIHLRLLNVVFILRLSRLLLGYSDHAKNGTCFVPHREDVFGDLTWNKNTFHTFVLHEYTSDSEIIITPRLVNIMEDIKDHIDEYKVYGQAQEERKIRIEEISEPFYSFTLPTEKTVKVDAPKYFEENFRVMSNESFEFKHLSMSMDFKEPEDLNAICISLRRFENNRKSVNRELQIAQSSRNCSKLDTCCLDSPLLRLSSDSPFQSSKAMCDSSSLTTSIVDQYPRDRIVTLEGKDLSFGEEINLMQFEVYSRSAEIFNQSRIRELHCKVKKPGKIKSHPLPKDESRKKTFSNNSPHLKVPRYCHFHLSGAEYDDSSSAASIVGQWPRGGMVTHAGKDLSFGKEVEVVPFEIDSSVVEMPNQSSIRKRHCKTSKHGKIKRHVLPEDEPRKNSFYNDSTLLSLPSDGPFQSSEAACDSCNQETYMDGQNRRDEIAIHDADDLNFGEELDVMSFEIDSSVAATLNGTRIRIHCETTKSGRIRRHVLPMYEPREIDSSTSLLPFPSIQQHAEPSRPEDFKSNLINRILKRYSESRKRRKVKRQVQPEAEPQRKDLSPIPYLFSTNQQRSPEDCPVNTTWYPINGTCLPISCQEGYTPDNGHCKRND